MGKPDRRSHNILRMWVKYGPIVVAFCGLMAVLDSAHTKEWLAVSAFAASILGGHKPQPMLNKGKQDYPDEAPKDGE